MSLTKTKMKTRLNTIVDSEVLDRVKSKFDNKGSSKEKEPIAMMPYLTGIKRNTDPDTYKGNIERFYGLAQVPVGLIGPLKVNGAYASEAYHVPLATTEGALVASYNRGAKVISKSGGANVLCTSEAMTRSPGFIFENIMESTQFVAWCSEQFNTFKEVVQSVTNHGHLEDFQSVIDGKYVWLNLQFISGDASGQNMVTIAADTICRYIAEFSPIRPKKWYVEANLCGDKKATKLSQNSGRGKNVVAEVTIPSKIVKKMLHTTVDEMVQYSDMAQMGGIHSGAAGIHGHIANALAAIFIACGQDAACVAESATGITKFQKTSHGDLYVSLNLPNLVVGTVGGGTGLPTQKECLELMDCFGAGKSRKFAEICAATALAGEISIAAAITAGHFTQAHIRYGRTKKQSQNTKEKEHVSNNNELSDQLVTK